MTIRELAGRDGELARLDALVRLAATGRGGLAWVQGEMGSGKSALLDAATAGAASAGCVVLRGAGDELTRAFPLRMLADSLGVSSHSDDAARAEIARLLRGETLASQAVDPVLAAAERMLDLVDRLCAEAPLVLVTEDLQWSDEQSLQVWNRLARAVGQIPLLLIASSRPVPYRPPLLTLQELVQERGGELVTLGLLDEGGVHQMTRQILQAAPGPLLAGELERAGGNPLHLRELIEALRRDGSIEVRGDRAEFRGQPGAVPDGLAAAMSSRLRFTDETLRDALRMAALVGSDFDLDELAIASGRSVADLARTVEEAIASGLVRDSGTRLTFRHPLVREALVAQTSMATREAVHRHLARELAGAGRGLEVIASHLLAASWTVEPWAVRWLAETPQPMLYAVPQVAGELLTRALGSIDAQDPSWDALGSRAARVMFWLARDEEAIRLAREVARRTRDPELAAQMDTIVLRAGGRSGLPPEATATAPTDERVPLPARARLAAWTAVILLAVGETERGREAAESALDQAQRSGDGLALGVALHAATLLRDAPSALECIDQALAGLGDDPESIDLRLLLTNNQLSYLSILSRWEEAESLLPSTLVLAERTGSPRAGWLLATAAEVHYMHGRWDDALVYLSQVDSDFPEVAMSLNAPALGALIALHRDERERGGRLLDAAGAVERETPVVNAVNWRLVVARALRAEVAGDPAGALDLVARWLPATTVPGQQMRQEVMPHLVRLALDAGDRRLAATVTEVCQADAEADPQPDKSVAARCCRALVDGDVEGLLEVAGEYQRRGWPLQLALAYEEAAAGLAGAGETERARDAFNRALRIYFSLGATWDLRRVEARLRPFGIRRGPRTLHRRATTGWESLTAAEKRVARLVGQGQSNPDIAAELFLSRRTVQTHVSNILAKLNLSSRLEIVREAAASRS